MAGVQGTVTVGVGSFPVTMPKSGLTVIGITVQKNTVGGYLSIPIDQGHNAILPFNTQRGVTTTDVAVGQFLDNNNTWHVHFTAGLQINCTVTGLTSGVVFIYYGTPFDDSKPLTAFAGVAVAVTTSTSLSFTFPGDVVLNGILYECGYNTAETNVNTDFQWNTDVGKSIDINFPTACQLKTVPVDNAGAAQSLTVTAAFDGTHVATGQLVLYYNYVKS